MNWAEINEIFFIFVVWNSLYNPNFGFKMKTFTSIGK